MHKDRWDKAEIIIKALAGILIPAVLLYGGILLNSRQVERNRILQESEMIKGFLPLLDGSRSTSLAAFRVLDESIEKKKVVKLAANYQSEAALEYLLEKSNSTDFELAALARNRLGAMKTIMLVDSAHPDNIYDENTIAEHGTNADDLYNALRPLALGPLYREEASRASNRIEMIAALRPAIIICHYSSFEYVTPGGNSADDKLKSFADKIIELSPSTKFVIYSRRSDIDKRVKKLGIKSNAVRSIQIPPSDPSFRDYKNYVLVINKVKELLNIGPTRLKGG